MNKIYQLYLSDCNQSYNIFYYLMWITDWQKKWHNRKIGFYSEIEHIWFFCGIKTEKTKIDYWAAIPNRFDIYL